MIYALLILMPVLSRASGGGIWTYKLNKKGAVGDDGADLGGIMPFNLTWLPEVLFSLPFGLAPGLAAHDVFVGVLAFAWSFIWMQSGNGNALHWGEGVYNPDRDTSFSPVVNAIADKFKIDRSSRNYCRIHMAVKGFLIGAPLFLIGGVILAVLWPLGYEIGHRFKDSVKDSNVIREALAGLGAAIAIIIFWEVFK